MSERVCCFFSCSVDDLKRIPGCTLIQRDCGQVLRLDGADSLSGEHLLFIADPKADPPVLMAMPHGADWRAGCDLTDMLVKARLSGVRVQGPWSPKQAAALGLGVVAVMDGDRLEAVEKIAYEPTDADVVAKRPPDRAKVFAAVTAAAVEAKAEPLEEEEPK